jgi:hypothetical protein
MMEALQRKLDNRDITFDAVDRRIMCFAHIINLSSGKVISAADNLESKPIGHSRQVVRGIRFSGKRREAFRETVQNGNSKGWFKVGNPPKTILVEDLQLLRDVRTRWDSVFFMLNRLREMRPV